MQQTYQMKFKSLIHDTYYAYTRLFNAVCYWEALKLHSYGSY